MMAAVLLCATVAALLLVDRGPAQAGVLSSDGPIAGVIHTGAAGDMGFPKQEVAGVMECPIAGVVLADDTLAGVMEYPTQPHDAPAGDRAADVAGVIVSDYTVAGQLGFPDAAAVAGVMGTGNQLAGVLLSDRT